MHADRTAFFVVPREGETACGDLVFVRSLAVAPGVPSATLFALVDALGHGPLAEFAARAAETSLREAPPELALAALVDRVHAALKGTRGAAMTAVLVRGRALSAAGVGNVALRSTGTALSFVCMPGVLGGRFRAPKVFTATLTAPTRIYLHSDGISSRFDPSALAEMRPAEAARALLERHGKRTDDAAVLVTDL